MMSRYLSPRHVVHLAKIIEAVQENRRVRWVDYNGTEFAGTLRGFTTQDSANSFTGKDIRDSWIRITLTQGGTDVWIETEEATGLLEEGSIAV